MAAHPFTTTDAAYMAQALRLAERGVYTTSPNPRVGCVMVKDGRVVGEGWHMQAGGPHAEVHALAMAGAAAVGATCYVTLEPCSHHGRTPPCADGLIKAGVARVVAAMVDPNPLVAGRGLRRLADAGIEVGAGLMADAAHQLNGGFIQRMISGRPRVTVKLGASLDGRTAMASGESQWITGAEARADVQRWRARSCAILTGAATVVADDPQLNVRWPDAEPYPLAAVRQPLRVVVDGQGRVSANARLFTTPGPVWIAGNGSGDHLQLRPQDRWLNINRQANGHLDLTELLQALGGAGVNDLWVEAGPTLAGALLAAGLVDQLVVYLAPRLLGNDARGLFHLPGLEHLAASPHLRFVDTRMVGGDLRLTALVEKG